jgi:hypothetical protein
MRLPLPCPLPFLPSLANMGRSSYQSLHSFYTHVSLLSSTPGDDYLENNGWVSLKSFQRRAKTYWIFKKTAPAKRYGSTNLLLFEQQIKKAARARLSLYSCTVACRGNSHRIKAIYGIRVVCHSPINHTNILSIAQNIPWINVDKIALSKPWMTNMNEWLARVFCPLSTNSELPKTF